MKFLVISSLFLVSVASATQYQPLIRCENGAVVFDRVIRDNPVFNGFQLVVHGHDLALRVNNIVGRSGILYAQGEFVSSSFASTVSTDNVDTAVFPTYVYKLNSGPLNYLDLGVYSSGDSLTLVAGSFNGGGSAYVGRYIFRGCRNEN